MVYQRGIPTKEQMDDVLYNGAAFAGTSSYARYVYNVDKRFSEANLHLSKESVMNVYASIYMKQFCPWAKDIREKNLSIFALATMLKCQFHFKVKTH